VAVLAAAAVTGDEDDWIRRRTEFAHLNRLHVDELGRNNRGPEAWSGRAISCPER